MEMGIVTHMSLNDACAREHWPALDGQCRCVRRMEKLEASAFACYMHATVFYTGFAVHSVFCSKRILYSNNCFQNALDLILEMDLC